MAAANAVVRLHSAPPSPPTGAVATTASPWRLPILARKWRSKVLTAKRAKSLKRGKDALIDRFGEDVRSSTKAVGPEHVMQHFIAEMNERGHRSRWQSTDECRIDVPELAGVTEAAYRAKSLKRGKDALIDRFGEDVQSAIEAVGPELVMSYVAAQMGGECRIDIGNLHGATVASEAGDRWDKGKRVPFGDGAAEYRVTIESECAFIASQARPCPLPRVHPSKDTLPCAHAHTYTHTHTHAHTHTRARARTHIRTHTRAIFALPYCGPQHSQTHSTLPPGSTR